MRFRLWIFQQFLNKEEKATQGTIHVTEQRSQGSSLFFNHHCIEEILVATRNISVLAEQYVYVFLLQELWSLLCLTVCRQSIKNLAHFLPNYGGKFCLLKWRGVERNCFHHGNLDCIPHLGFYRIDWLINHLRTHKTKTCVKAQIFVFKKTVMMHAWVSESWEGRREKCMHVCESQKESVSMRKCLYIF